MSELRRLEETSFRLPSWDEVITVTRRAEEFRHAVAALRGSHGDDRVLTRRLSIAEHYLGPLDGGASERVLAILRKAASDWVERRGPAENELRGRLAARRPPLRLSRHGRAGLCAARRRVGAMLGR